MDLKQKLINLVCKPTPTSLTMPTARWSSMLDEAPQTAGPTSFQVRLRRVVSVVALSGLSLGFASACGSDDSSADAFCDAGDSLRSNIETIGDIDIIARDSASISSSVFAVSVAASFGATGVSAPLTCQRPSYTGTRNNVKSIADLPRMGSQVFTQTVY